MMIRQLRGNAVIWKRCVQNFPRYFRVVNSFGWYLVLMSRPSAYMLIEGNAEDICLHFHWRYNTDDKNSCWLQRRRRQRRRLRRRRRRRRKKRRKEEQQQQEQEEQEEENQQEQYHPTTTTTTTNNITAVFKKDTHKQGQNKHDLHSVWHLSCVTVIQQAPPVQ